MNKIEIDFFELQVLIEASWHSGTILRHSIMQKAINVWYRELNENERARTYEFFLRTKEAELEIQKRFMARYNPDNQFKVSTRFKEVEQLTNAYLFNDKYWIDVTTRIDEKYIIHTEKVQPAV